MTGEGQMNIDTAKLNALIDSKRQAVLEFLREAVSCSTPCNPEESGFHGPNFQHLVASKLTDMGFVPRVWIPEVKAIRSHYPTMGHTFTYESRPNVVAVWRGTASSGGGGNGGSGGGNGAGSGVGGNADRGAGRGRSLVLNTHADVYGPGNVDSWAYPPFAGRVEGGRVHGRGTVDAKGSVTAYLFALQCLREAGFEPAGDITFQSVADEEGGGNGTMACILEGYTGDAVLMGEPTGLAISPGSRGATHLRLRVVGQEAHAGLAYEGVNAIAKTTLYMQALWQLEGELDAKFKHPLWDPFPKAHTMNVEWIHSGGFGGVVPGFSEALMAVGCIGGESIADVRRWVTEAFAKVTEADPWLREHPPELIWGPLAFEPSATDPRHPFVQTAVRAAREVLGRDVPVHALSAGSDMRFFCNQAGLPGLHFGPGDLRLAHSTREFVELDEVMAAIKVLIRLIPDWTMGRHEEDAAGSGRAS